MKKKKKKQKIEPGSFKKTWSYVLPHFIPYRKQLVVVVALAFVASLFEPSLAVSMKLSLKMVLEKPDLARRLLWVFPFFLIGLFVFRGTFNFLSKYLLERLCLRVMRNIQIKLYDHYMFLSLDHYERTTTGEMMARTVNDASHMQRIVPLSIDALSNIFQLIGLIAVCFYMDPYLSILAMLAFPLTVFPVQFASTRMRRYTKKGLAQTAVLSSMMQETYSGAKVVKAFAMEQKEVEHYRGIMNGLLKIQYKYAAVKHAISPLIAIIASVGIAPVAYLAALRVFEIRDNPAMVDNLAGYVVAVGLMFNPVRKLGTTFGHFSSAYGAAERIRETFEKVTAVKEAPDAIELPPFREAVRYENVSFSYNSTPVLSDFNLEAKKGELIALVGVSGSGKTTVVNLLPRFYDVTAGRIAIDGIDIRGVTLKSLRMQIGVVTQETFLFNDTVAHNIAYGSEGKTREEVIQAAKAANAHEFIIKLPKGYDTDIGERGVRLSGGERQRIAIARALMKNPPLLILDEATSALDTAAEREVQKALDSVVKNRTTFAIAHRLSTITHADKIVVIKQGRIVEQGSHAELMKKAGEYKRLYEMQFFLGDYAKDHYQMKTPKPEEPSAEPDQDWEEDEED